jgi:phenylalanyl-tRNA synthetase beta chain
MVCDVDRSIGCDIDSCNENTLEVEIFPDRPDMLSAETLAHTMIPFLHQAEPKPELDVTPGSISMIVESEIGKMRMYIEGFASPDNPKTSSSTAFSVLAYLKKMTSNFIIGT